MKIEKLKKKFIETFGENKNKIQVFFAPGRVNIIGEHIDYNGGLVFPAALTLGNTVLIRKREDNLLNIAADDLVEIASCKLEDLLQFKGKKSWGSYQFGVIYELVNDNINVCGCDMLFSSNLPFGSGLSSSASIEVATALAMYCINSQDTTRFQNNTVLMKYLAVLSQRAENNFVGVNCGIMDQFSSALGKENCGILLNCDTLDFEYIPLNLGEFCLVIGNTKAKRSLADSKYNQRRYECEEALEILKEPFPQLENLCQLTEKELLEHKQKFLNPIVFKRARHVISEQQRVLSATKALKNGDLITLGELLNQSHDSLRDDYEVTGEHLDKMVEAAWRCEGVLGSRMTGAGFGGCTVSIVEKDFVEKFIKKVGEAYFKSTQIIPEFYVSDICCGAKQII